MKTVHCINKEMAFANGERFAEPILVKDYKVEVSDDDAGFLTSNYPNYFSSRPWPQGTRIVTAYSPTPPNPTASSASSASLTVSDAGLQS